jgi:hypothetical protein
MVSESGRFGTYWIRNGKAEVAMPAMPKEEDR